MEDKTITGKVEAISMKNKSILLNKSWYKTIGLATNRLPTLKKLEIVTATINQAGIISNLELEIKPQEAIKEQPHTKTYEQQRSDDILARDCLKVASHTVLSTTTNNNHDELVDDILKCQKRLYKSMSNKEYEK